MGLLSGAWGSYIGLTGFLGFGVYSSFGFSLTLAFFVRMTSWLWSCLRDISLPVRGSLGIPWCCLKADIISSSSFVGVVLVPLKDKLGDIWRGKNHLWGN